MSSIFHKSLCLGCKVPWRLKMLFAAFRARLMEMLAEAAVIMPVKVSVMCLKGSRSVLLEAEDLRAAERAGHELCSGGSVFFLGECGSEKEALHPAQAPRDWVFLKPWKHTVVPLCLTKLNCHVQVSGALAIAFYHLCGQEENTCCDGAVTMACQ